MTMSLIMPSSAAGLPTWGVTLVLIAFIVAILIVITRRR
ncbi:hypothetical protein K388_06553 [Streptomyces sp. KhCrAH-43]|nr:hypothetical protein K388_06553 [Streptomyces sp. KhCrAH-43]